MPDSGRRYDVPEKASGTLAEVGDHESGYAKHYQDRERVKLNSEFMSRRRAQWWGGAICLVALVGAIITALAGAHPAVSIALVGIPIVASIWAIVGKPIA
jgi:hypothetical protein